MFSRLGHAIIRFVFPILLVTFFWQTRIPLGSSYQVYDYLIPFLYLSTCLIIILIVASLVVDPRWIFKSWSHDRITVALTWLLFLVFGWGIYTQSLNALGGWYHLLTIILLSRFALWLMGKKDEFSLEYIMKYLTIGLIPLIGLGLVQMILGHTLGIKIIGEWEFSASALGVSNIEFFGVKTLRPYATFPHPNVFGGVMVVFALYWVYRWIGLRVSESTHFTDSISRSMRATPYLSLLFIFGVLVSFSLTAWIALFVGLAVYIPSFLQLLQSGKLKKIPWWLIVASTVFAGVIAYASLRLFAEDTLSLTRRLALNDVGVRMFLDYPVFGVGLNQSILHISSYWDTALLPLFTQPIHHVWLLLLAESGVCGFALIVVLMAWIVCSRLFVMPIFLIATWVALIVISFGDHYLFTLQSGLLISFLTIGITLRYDKRCETA